MVTDPADVAIDHGLDRGGAKRIRQQEQKPQAVRADHKKEVAQENGR